MLLGLTVDGVATTAAIVAIVLLLAGLAIAFFVKAVVMKVLGLVVTIVLALLLWSQRASMQDCADQVAQDVEQSGVGAVEAECSFFGFDVTVKVPTTRP
jgi:hypothetical protein